MTKIPKLSAIVVILFVSAATVLGLHPVKADETNHLEILNLNVSPVTIRVGDTFSINANIFNNSTSDISVQNGCGGPFLVNFDSHASVGLDRICTWMPVQIILKPGENITVTSLSSNLAYKAISVGTANATLTFSYQIRNQSSPVLPSNLTSIAKSFSFAINDIKGEPDGANGIISPLKQFKSGTLSKDVQCNSGFRLLFKVTNGYPACILSSDVARLVLWGWARPTNDNTQGSGQENSSSRIITLSDNGRTITFKNNERFLLKLGNEYNWNIEIDNQTVVSRVINIMVIKDAQGVYESHNYGKATLTAVGDPFCLSADPPCKIHSILFQLNIVVPR